MTDELERLRGRDEHLAQWAVGEVKALRQRVTELEEINMRVRDHRNHYRAELAALKREMVEPVACKSLLTETLPYLQRVENTPWTSAVLRALIADIQFMTGVKP